MKAITLAMWAYALLSVVRAQHLQELPLPPSPSAGVDSRAEPWVPLSVPELRRLLWPLVLAVQRTAQHISAWSRWRRWHQSCARYYHYKQRGALVPQLPL